MLVQNGIFPMNDNWLGIFAVLESANRCKNHSVCICSKTLAFCAHVFAKMPELHDFAAASTKNLALQPQSDDMKGYFLVNAIGFGSRRTRKTLPKTESISVSFHQHFIHSLPFVETRDNGLTSAALCQVELLQIGTTLPWTHSQPF